MESVVYSNKTPLGKLQGLGNHMLMLYAGYSHCLDNGFELKISNNSHPSILNAKLKKCELKDDDYYEIRSLTDITPNGKPYQMFSGDGTREINGMDPSYYKHNRAAIIDAMNVSGDIVDACVMHIRVYSSHPEHNTSLAYYINALKNTTSRTIYYVYGFGNWDIQKRITEENVKYITDRLKVIFPDRQFIDVHELAEYSDPDTEIEESLHWRLMVNCHELITAISTFSLSTAFLRNGLTITPEMQSIYGLSYNLTDFGSNIVPIPINVMLIRYTSNDIIKLTRIIGDNEHEYDIYIFTDSNRAKSISKLTIYSHIHVLIEDGTSQSVSPSHELSLVPDMNGMKLVCLPFKLQYSEPITDKRMQKRLDIKRISKLLNYSYSVLKYTTI